MKLFPEENAKELGKGCVKQLKDVLTDTDFMCIQETGLMGDIPGAALERALEGSTVTGWRPMVVAGPPPWLL